MKTRSKFGGKVRDPSGTVHGYDLTTVGSFEEDMTDCERFFHPYYSGFGTEPKPEDWIFCRRDVAITCEGCKGKFYEEVVCSGCHGYHPVLQPETAIKYLTDTKWVQDLTTEVPWNRGQWAFFSKKRWDQKEPTYVQVPMLFGARDYARCFFALLSDVADFEDSSVSEVVDGMTWKPNGRGIPLKTAPEARTPKLEVLKKKFGKKKSK